MIHPGTKILFIAPRFFGYSEKIKIELEKIGCLVFDFDDRPSSNSIIKALIRIFPSLVKSVCDKYYNTIMSKCVGWEFDIVFVIKGESFSIDSLNKFKIKYKNAKFIYYTWDSLRNFKIDRAILSCYDKIFSFDKLDCTINSSIEYLPLFYLPEYDITRCNNTEKYSFDFLSICSLHSDRYDVLFSLRIILKEINPLYKFNFYLFHQSKLAFFIRKMFDRGFRSIPWKVVEWHSLTTSQTIELIKGSRILVDVHHPAQAGLTMRTIESVGARKKLITTNPDIVNYDFYCPQNIAVIDRRFPVIEKKFIDTPYVNLDENIYKKYSLDSWIKKIFS
jgi:hypothetical protein